jgi:hypothetical protein
MMRVWGFGRGCAAIALAAAAFGAVVLGWGPQALHAATTATFDYTGAEQDWVVPTGVTSITVQAFGAAGGSGKTQAAAGNSSGGTGGSVTATIAVTPGQTLAIFVGGHGTDATGTDTGTGGFNGGGSANFANNGRAAGGGGASDVRQGGTALGDRVVVAGGGGGGGAGFTSAGGDGGAGGGTTGANGGNSGGAFGGSGGTPTAGGAGGAADSPGDTQSGTDGAAGTGGVGGGSVGQAGGGGGGGYFGGGGGGEGGWNPLNGGGGGGGSSFAAPAATSVSHTQGGHTGDGQVILTFTASSSTSVTASANPSTSGAPVTFTATVAGASPSGTAQFLDGGVAIAGCGAATVTAGTATCTTSALTVGAHTISAVYGGDSGNTTSTSPGLAHSVVVTSAPSAPQSAPSPPGSPTGVTVVLRNGEAVVSWIAPESEGASSISSYTVTSAPDARTCTWTGGPLTCTVTGLTEGRTYRFSVVAVNSVGAGPSGSPAAPLLVADTHAPSAPTGLAGRFAGGRLQLSWTAADDNVGVDHYEIQLDGVTVLRVAGSATSAALRTFHPRGRSFFTVHAADASGNQSASPSAVGVVARARPKAVPKAVPGWAWRVLAWELRGKVGARPEAPHPLPRWYAAWHAWRLQPFGMAA